MKKVTFLLVVTLLTGLFVSIFPLGIVEASTPVSGIITTDTTWTKTNSPYTLTGPVGVLSGVMLTIEPGTVVNLNKYNMNINGTLSARGTSNDKIRITGVDGSPPSIPLGSSLAISFTYGITIKGAAAIENALIKSVRIALIGPNTIYNCSITGFVSAGWSSDISNNLINGLIVVSGTSKVSNNNISGGIQSIGGSPVIFGNMISINNHLNYGIQFIWTDNIEITNNTISGGISAGGGANIESNLINGSTEGITVSGDGSVTIQGNTIAKNNKGITFRSGIAPIITNNNFQYNSYNIYLSGSDNINAVNNWWGTTDQQAINQSIHDSKNDFNLGTVTFVPFLTVSNPQAPSAPDVTSSTTTPTQNSTQTPAATSSQANPSMMGRDWTPIFIIALVIVISVLLIIFAVMLLYKKK
jgi:hypothetical protein